MDNQQMNIRKPEGTLRPGGKPCAPIYGEGSIKVQKANPVTDTFALLR
jgi:hypothetical protein